MIKQVPIEMHFLGIAILFFIAMFLAWISKYGKNKQLAI